MALDLNLWDLRGGGGVGWGWPGGWRGGPCILCSSMGWGGGGCLNLSFISSDIIKTRPSAVSAFHMQSVTLVSSQLDLLKHD